MAQELRFWTDLEINDLKIYYPHKDLNWLKQYFNRSKASITNKAIRLNITKTLEYLENSPVKNFGKKLIRKGLEHHYFNKKRSIEDRQKISNNHFVLTRDIKAELNRKQRFKIGEDKMFSILNALNIDFIYQHPNDYRIMDFYIPSIKLNIEIDGPEHKVNSLDKKQLDDKNDALIYNQGINILRIDNRLSHQEMLEIIKMKI